MTNERSESLTPIKLMVAFIMIANLADAGFTLYWVETGLATEWNPVMRYVLNWPEVFVLTKVALVTLGVLLLWLQRRQPLAFVGLLLGNIGLCVAMAVHFTLMITTLKN